MTTGWRGTTAAPPNSAYAGQVVHFPDPVRASRYPHGVRVDEHGYPDFSLYARAAAEVAEPPDGFGGDELRLTDFLSANAALHASGHELWKDLPPVATPCGWTWHHTARSRRMELVPVEVKALLRHHGGLATARADHHKRGTRPLREARPAHFETPGGDGELAVTEGQVTETEERLGYRLPGPYRAFLKAAGGGTPRGVPLDAELGVLVDQPFFTLRDEAAVDDLVYVNKCLRDHLTKDYLGVAFVQGGVVALRVRGERQLGSVWFCPYDDARDGDGSTAPERMAELLLPCGDDFDDFLLRLSGNTEELAAVANPMVDGGFARAVPVKG